MALLTTLLATGLMVAAPKPMLQDPKFDALSGVWVFVDDLTPGRTLEQFSPPMSSTFTFKTEPGAMILVWGHGGSQRDVRVKLDGSVTEIAGQTAGTSTRYSGSWKDGVFSYEISFVRAAGKEPENHIRRSFRMTEDGLIVRFAASDSSNWIGIYKHPEDIAMPNPIKATINDLAWLSGTWTGSRGTGGAITFEERWSPPKGGSMLATSRTVSRDKMSAFEFLRIVERDGGLIYVAQPNGGTATEFVMTEFSSTRAVFDNPRHDYPKRIIYELGSEGKLTATIGYMKGGTPRKFEFKREGS